MLVARGKRRGEAEGLGKTVGEARPSGAGRPLMEEAAGLAAREDSEGGEAGGAKELVAGLAGSGAR